jgi:hypothetical protein
VAKNNGTSKVNLGAGGIISASKGSAKIKEIVMPDPGGIISASKGSSKIKKGK